MHANYFFIDGSALTAQIRQLQRAHPQFRDRKLCPKRLMDHLMAAHHDLHEGAYKRVTFYFPKGDEINVESFIDVPDHRKPGEMRDMHFKYCGHKLKKSAEFDKFVEENVPPKFRDRFAKSEKGIDIEICCDALKLASTSKLERLFLLTNDGDFIPMCRTLKEFGANISIIHLSDVVLPNGDLLHEADSYDVVPVENLSEIFSVSEENADALVLDGNPVSEKSDGANEENAVNVEKPNTDGGGIKAADQGEPELKFDAKSLSKQP